ncbi:MAG: diguanylate cyclase [Clostridiales bacterium]|nr:diguanylate cyclase [Clostridiales bacterium]
MENNYFKGNWPRKLLLGNGSISARFRNAITLLFALAFIAIIIAMSSAFDGLLYRYSADVARRYAVSSAEAFGAHIGKEIGLLSKAAHSGAVIEWMADENNEAKKALAFEELSAITGELYSYNLYVGIEGSFNEYAVEQDYRPSSHRPFAVLDENDPIDEWYFDCVTSERAYLIKVGMDHVLQRKRVWLDYKVVKDGAVLGVICTGLEFSYITGELYSQFDNENMRGFILDDTGIIYMDSSLLLNDEYLRNDFESRMDSLFSDKIMLAALNAHLDDMAGYSEASRIPGVVRLPDGVYRFVTIAPIRYTNWSSVILSDLSPNLNIKMLMPLILIILLSLIAFAIATNAISRRLIFLPLERLVSSLGQIKNTGESHIYGAERTDEFGKLSVTIQDLFTKANYDALTGIYNRRFMETNLNSLMGLLSRSGSFLSILMIDVDFFKLYNDTYGHDQGDACLRAVATALGTAVTRASDFAARYGGEEFVIALPHADEAGARMIAEKLLEDVRGLNIPHEKNAAADCVTVSVGVMTAVTAHTHKWEEYIKCADEALYISKQSGRNRYTHHNYPADRQ